MKGYIDDSEFGRMMVTARRGMRNMTFRWKNEHVEIGVPYGTRLAEIEQLVDINRDRIRRLSHPKVAFFIGQTIPLFRSQITISEDARLKKQLVQGWDQETNTFYLRLPVGINLENEQVKRVISRSLSELMGMHAARFLIPYANELTSQLGLQVKRFEIGRGMRKLGHCAREGIIQLSRNLMFMPERLVETVICHELAHLTHMDHSPAFHALVTKYLGEPQSRREKEVDTFVWPILR